MPLRNIKDHKKHHFKAIFEGTTIKRSGLKFKLIHVTLGIKRKSKNRTLRSRNILFKRKIHTLYLKDDVSRATAEKNETNFS